MKTPLKVAYFSMEFAIDSRIPNYAGGLGVLAADMMHSFADMEFPAVGVSLIYHQDDNAADAFPIEKFMKRLPETVEVQIENRTVTIGVFQYDIRGVNGNTVPIYFLSTYLPENKGWDRDLTKNLYASSDQYTRLGQEIILGIGGVRMLRKLGYDQVENFHMNEGHSAFLTFELLKEQNYHDEEVKGQCTFTTHTPVKAGHDYFDYRLVNKVLGKMVPWHITKLATEKSLSMTHLAMNLSKQTNSVSERHRQVCSEMFPGYKFANVTNGIHHLTWISKPFESLFDTKIPQWKEEPAVLSDAEKVLSAEKVKKAHQKNKKEFVTWINEHEEFFPTFSERCNEDHFDAKTLTIGFARRFVPYKRPDLIFRNIEKLRELGYRKLQLVFAGRCHPSDQFCNMRRGELRKYAKELRGQIRVAVIPEYNVDIAHRLISGVDVWLNNPIKPHEASGTSGMKAALNGVLNLSILDGWWIEGFEKKPKAGWAFGEKSDQFNENTRDDLDAHELYERLAEVMDCYYERPKEWTERMKAAISLVGHFNTQRSVEEYAGKMWNIANDIF